MKIFLILSIITLVLFFLSNKVFYSAKINLFKNQAAWSGNDIKIKYSNSKGILKSNRSDNYLKIIADESKIYLEDQSKKEEEEEAE